MGEDGPKIIRAVTEGSLSTVWTQLYNLLCITDLHSKEWNSRSAIILAPPVLHKVIPPQHNFPASCTYMLVHLHYPAFTLQKTNVKNLKYF